MRGGVFLTDDEAARACLRALSASMGRNERCLCVDPVGEDALAVAGSAVVVVDIHHRILHFNQRAAALTGWSPDEVLGRRCTDAMRCTNGGEECSLFDAGAVFHRHMEIEDRAGARIQIVKEGQVIRDEQGHIVGGIETLHDVTDLRQAQHSVVERFEALQSRCNLLESFAESLDEGFAAVDERGRLLCLSQRAAQMLGLLRDQAYGIALGDLLTDASDLLAKIGFVLSTRGRAEASGLDLRALAPGDSSLSMRLSPLLDGAGSPIGAVLALRRQDPVGAGDTFYGIVGQSSAMRRLIRQIQAVAAGDGAVLISGETGTGKELVARAIHLSGARAQRPFHAVNCAALTQDLLESELFGHERGAFTGAVRDKPGRFELARDGTLLLDEVGCLPLAMQAKLLRVLESREYERLGGTRSLQFRARVIAATNSVLEDLVRAGSFREDLYYRLNVLPLAVPPLRERGADILLLARHFGRQLARSGRPGGQPVEFTPAAVDCMQAHAWPGNVRELRNVLLYALTLGDGVVVNATDLPPAFEARMRHARADQGETERARIEDALRRAKYNRGAAADLLGVSRTTLWRRLRALGIEG